VRSARYVTNCWLPAHQLRFHKWSASDNSGKADVVESAAEAIVHGIVISLWTPQIFTLDEYEGVGYGYWRRKVEVETSRGKMEAWMYYATGRTYDDLRPYDWYLRHILEGAKLFGLPDVYIAWLASQETWMDPSFKRWKAESAYWKLNPVIPVASRGGKRRVS
jgi:gamma-glutamylcyclotransferase